MKTYDFGNDYLVEKSLGNMLDTLYGASNVVRQKKFGAFKSDYFVTIINTVVEFDGDQHYCNPVQQRRDVAKDKLIASAGHKLVRIPYWVQLDSEMFKHYFGEQADVKTTFPHGFISNLCILPAAFNGYGACRWGREMDSLPQRVRDAVKQSLAAKAMKADPTSVYGVGRHQTVLEYCLGD